MTRTLAFTVAGLPAPQGSKRHLGKGILVESSKAVKPWREAVKYAALDAIDLRESAASPWQPFDGPLLVTAVFWLPRPKSAPKKRWAPDRKPDVDKLLRGCLDAITDAGVWHDDAQVVRINASKSYVGGWFDLAILEYGLREPAHPGASIVVSEVVP
jgi:crossover junction endodeoxyribonuclease RusA